MVASRAWSTGR